ncbi:division/cell wall cluster transcriptional repressor MraZ [Pajaroellobacter abortibovis]|uniref:Transcriptional regulator MraZ n=1 Tax=Pajaroellobacter abortibovis TaxID=1882918 RepID=A0A1L6MVW2_9BACT|nr:division/cell wall cluster transcriptional repressor MraZ [Pajaroellobacter abortibovis]APR99679.1 division/cell wall cluster transcriptional repressor MraZ [Pajaroellobacter abortibovis]
MFRGRYEHTMDAKGRTSVPARYREALQKGGERYLVVTGAFDACLNVYPFQEWLLFEEKLSMLPQFDLAVIRLKRLYVSGAVECEIDESGRILIPPTLRDHARLSKHVLWAGSGKYAELWSKEGWEHQVEVAEAERQKLGIRLAELGL